MSSLYGQNKSFGAALSESLSSTVEAMLSVCANIVLFSVLSACLREALALLFGTAGTVSILLLGTLELAGGCAASHVLPFSKRIVYISALLGFGGFSVHSQTVSLAQKSGLHLRGFVLFKALQGVMSALLLVLFLSIFPMGTGEDAAYIARPGIAAAIFLGLSGAVLIGAAFKSKSRPIRKRSHSSG